MALFAITLLSSAVAGRNGCEGDTIAEVLAHYGFPPGIFPENVKDFKCDDDVLTIQLERDCTSTLDLFGVKNVIKYNKVITGNISYREFSNVNGITADLSSPLSKDPLTLTVVRVAVIQQFLFGDSVQFYSQEGIFSPGFPVFLFSEPRRCDRLTALDDGSTTTTTTAVVANNKKDTTSSSTPQWVYKYGRLLPFVAA